MANTTDLEYSTMAAEAQMRRKAPALHPNKKRKVGAVESSGKRSTLEKCG
jgi:hypothetical protein